MVEDRIYESAIQGRREFRAAFRQQKKRADKFGLALMMIREGCADPAGFAAEILAKFEH